MGEPNYDDLTCGECGIRFFVPHNWLKQRRDEGGGYTCPNGHGRIFRESATDIIRRERDGLKQEMARLVEEAERERRWRHQSERRVSAARGQITRLKNRAAAGVCPCCNRTFVNLARHMGTKHKGF